MVLNVARNREKEGAFTSGGRFSGADGVDGGVYAVWIRTAPSPKSPSSSVSEDTYMEPQLGSSSPGVGDRDRGERFWR